jgi:hypothetical protein
VFPESSRADTVIGNETVCRYDAGSSDTAASLRADGRDPTGVENSARGNAVLRLVHRGRL